jgi:hypothetical protein
MVRYWSEVFEEEDGSTRLGTTMEALRTPVAT